MTRVRNVQGKIVETTGGNDISYAKEDIVLNAIKQISFTGDDKGILFGKPADPPELKIEKSEYLLESRFALEQLFNFAKKDSKAMFCFWMADIFGHDIPLEAYEKLYQEASDKKESLNPKITVALNLPGYGASYNSDKRSKYFKQIIISQGFIDNAIESNKYQKLLLLALVEEFGHHLDYLLRNEFSTASGDASGDEGAKYSGTMNRRYKQFLIDPFQQKEQHYATAKINGKEQKLIWDFSDLHEKLKEYVDNRTDKDDNYFAGYEFFGAGLGDDLHGLGHQSIENRGLGDIDRYRDKTKGSPNAERQQIYFGNWLRDFSQFIDPMIIRPMANALDALSDDYKKKNVSVTENQNIIDDISKLMEENNVTKEDTRSYTLPANFKFSILARKAEIEWKTTTFSPVKLSREAVTSLVELIGIKEFGELKVEKDNKEGKPQNYMKYLEDFRKKYSKVTSSLLGVYKPQEHIDNPLALHPKFICEANKKKGKSCPPADFNHKLDPDFVKDPVDSQWQNNRIFGTKNYIRGNGAEPFESAFDCFIKFIDKSDPNTVDGRINFGAALHILEDYYAHSNFSELAIMKVYDPNVFPWDNLPTSCKSDELKKHKADFTSNKHAIESEIDRTKIRYKTLSNPELRPQSVQNHMNGYKSNNPSEYYMQLDKTTIYDPERHYRNKGLYYSHAECAIVQTGSFGPLDTIASVAPKINNKIFSIKVEDQEKLKEGERTFNDTLIYELLKDISNAQSLDTKEKNPNYKGTDDNMYSDMYLKYLDFRDMMVKERWFGGSYSDVFNAFGIFDFVTKYIKVIQNIFYHFLALTAINLIDDYQTYLDNELTLLEQGNWKVNDYGPTHTQIAKDNGIQPLHHLAVELASNAVHQVGELFKKRDLDGIKRLADSTLFVHPMYTDWMDEIVIKWCNENKTKVQLAHESSIVLYGIRHGYQEIAELSHQIGIISEFNTSKEQQEEFNSRLAGIPEKWKKGMEKLNRLWEQQGLNKPRLKSAEETHQEHLKESGYDQ